MTNAYVDLALIKSPGGLNLATGTAYDTRLRTITEAISREADRYTNRHFFYSVDTLNFDGNGKTELDVPDLISIGTLLEDTNYDGTFETTWASTDFILYPRNAGPTSTHIAEPYTYIKVSDLSNSTQDIFLRGLSNYRIAGTWGYSKITHTSGLAGTLADGTTTNLVLSGSATGNIEIGHTLLINDELVYVTGITTGTLATVRRSINGSTGTIHLGQAVNVIDYPGPVTEAVFIQLSRLWRRKDSGFASQVGMPETGMMMSWRGSLDPDVKTLLASYRKLIV